jgi:hypothetical protein
MGDGLARGRTAAAGDVLADVVAFGELAGGAEVPPAEQPAASMAAATASATSLNVAVNLESSANGQAQCRSS